MKLRKRKPMSEESGAIGCMLFLMGLAFTVIGGTVGFSIVGEPLVAYVTSLSWVETPAWIESNEAIDETTAYRADIRFSYSVNGAAYSSDRILFGESSGLAEVDITALKEKYPVGSETVCYVSPSDPQEAVLERRIDLNSLIGGAMTSIFFFVGLGLLFAGFRLRRTGGKLRQTKWQPSQTSYATFADPNFIPSSENGPIELKEQASPLLKLIGTSIVALLWCSITFGATYGIYRDGEWGGALFLIPFQAIAFVLIGAVGYFILAMTNARPTLVMPRNYLVSGETINLGWRLNGNVSPVEKLEIFLVGKESATYRRGTRTVTDTKEFLKKPLITVTEKGAFRSGDVSITIPAGLMHTFEANNNKIQYSVKVQGSIHRWPDIHSEFSIVVAPKR